MDETHKPLPAKKKKDMGEKIWFSDKGDTERRKYEPISAVQMQASTICKGCLL